MDHAIGKAIVYQENKKIVLISQLEEEIFQVISPYRRVTIANREWTELYSMVTLLGGRKQIWETKSVAIDRSRNVYEWNTAMFMTRPLCSTVNCEHPSPWLPRELREHFDRVRPQSAEHMEVGRSHLVERCLDNTPGTRRCYRENP
jgi:hypothetical protein